MTDYQPLNSAEEVQRALKDGRAVECMWSGDDGWRPVNPKDIDSYDAAYFVSRGVQYRAPLSATPEAERSQDAVAPIGSPERNLAVLREMLTWEFVKHAPPTVAALEAAIAALSLPAAQDGVTWDSALRQAFYAVSPRDLTAAAYMAKVESLAQTILAAATPNAIRGDNSLVTPCEFCGGRGFTDDGHVEWDGQIVSAPEGCVECDGRGTVAIRDDKGAEAVDAPLIDREEVFAALRVLANMIEGCGSSVKLTHASSLCCAIHSAIGNRWNQPRAYDATYVREAINAAAPTQAAAKEEGDKGAEAVADLPTWLRWVADELVKRDTHGGTFAPGVAQSLRGRAYVLELATPPTNTGG